MIDLYKYPRLYLNKEFKENAEIFLSAEHAHYLKNVIRKNSGDILRLFNGKDGEWLASILSLGKKQCKVILTKRIKSQPVSVAPLYLFFSPIKKQRMDFLIEKSVELGVSGLFPVMMNRTVNRKFNEDRVRAQIIEAAEQCERLDLPILHPIQSLFDVISDCDDVNIYACLERDMGAKPLSCCSYKDGAAFIIGPEGGFDNLEVDMILSNNDICIVGLGAEILRAETAAIACLSYARMSRD